jgi:hypothetical protein
MQFAPVVIILKRIDSFFNKELESTGGPKRSYPKPFPLFNLHSSHILVLINSSMVAFVFLVVPLLYTWIMIIRIIGDRKSKLAFQINLTQSNKNLKNTYKCTKMRNVLLLKEFSTISL